MELVEDERYQNTSDIRVMDVDGSNLAILLKDAQSPSWSPDGSKITCVSGQEGKSEVWIVNADGGDVKNLNHAGIVSPVWSPDRSHIAFVSSTRSPSLFRAGRIDIWVINADGSSPTILTPMD
ncbi:TolB family protein [Chloroflexota bacterium]